MRLLTLLVVVALAGCAPRSPRPDSAGASEVSLGIDTSRGVRSGGAAESGGAVPMPSAPATPPSGAPNDRSGLDSLERVARALARTDGCSGAGECRSVPIGAKACGGPRDYLVYCARTADTVALFRAVAALERAEKAYNASHQIASTCEMRVAPLPALVGGRCSAGAGGGNAGPR